MEQTSELPYPPWWGEYSIDCGQTGMWEIGPLKVTLQRQEAEWQVRYLSTETENDDSDPAQVCLAASPLDDQAICHRHVIRMSEKPIQVVPALADRSVVTRPLTPFHLSPGEEVRLFVGTIVWLQIYAYKSGPLLLDIPAQRPSDTWFGSSTRHGEIGYATRTHARLAIEEVPVRSFRAITPVKIINRSETALLLERLLLPIPHLSLFSSSSGRLWTEELSILCDEEMTSAHLRIGNKAPMDAVGAQKLTAPRLDSDRGVLIRALGAIFG